MRTILKFGLIIGIVESLLLLLCLANISGFPSDGPAYKAHALARVLSLLSLILGLYLVIRQTGRGREDTFTYKMALMAGIKTTGIAALFFSAFTFFYGTVINVHFRELMVMDLEKVLLASGVTAQELQAKLESAHNDFSPSMQVLHNFMRHATLGLVASFILALSLRRRASDSSL